MEDKNFIDMKFSEDEMRMTIVLGKESIEHLLSAREKMNPLTALDAVSFCTYLAVNQIAREMSVTVDRLGIEKEHFHEQMVGYAGNAFTGAIEQAFNDAFYPTQAEGTVN